jgi:hypothetical protein
MFKIGQKVYNSRFGSGTVRVFEQSFDVRAHCTYSDNYVDGSRVGVALDNPANWSLSDNGKNLCFFLPSELSKKED